jgi:hypothetical protein
MPLTAETGKHPLTWSGIWRTPGAGAGNGWNFERHVRCNIRARREHVPELELGLMNAPHLRDLKVPRTWKPRD